jgi:anti-anti-sigma factor
MSLSIHGRTDNGAMVVTLAGAADAAMLEPLRDPLSSALSDATVLVLDLDELTVVDGEGLRALILEVLSAAEGGQLRIAASHAATVSALIEARIHHVVPVHHRLPDALASVGDTDPTQIAIPDAIPANAETGMTT